MNGKRYSRWNVLLSCAVALMLISTTVVDVRAGAETETPALGPPTLAEIEFYLDRIDTLEVDLAQCEQRLAWAEEDPPECGGVGWFTLALAVGLGLFIGVVAE